MSNVNASDTKNLAASQETKNLATSQEIVSKVWNYAHVLRDDGVGYGDYVEQITYLIFLKMAFERAEA